MSKALFSIVLIICVLLACIDRKSAEAVTWRIEECSAENWFLKKGTELSFYEDCVECKDDLTNQIFPAIISETRLVIRPGPEKLLFKIDRPSDSVWILTELYNKHPQTITMKKIKTSKKTAL